MSRFALSRWIETFFSTKRKNRKRHSRRSGHAPQPQVENLEDRALLAAVVTDLTDANLTAQLLAQSLVGDGITISNVTYTGDDRGAGSFTDGFSDGLGIDVGVVLSSGAVTDIPGPNDTGSETTGLGEPGDADLTALAGSNTNDASILEFDFIPTSDTLSFTYLFASEEYPEFAPPNNSNFNDIFAFFLDGTNIALLPGTTTPVSINNVNAVTNNQFYNDNATNPAPFGTQFDGFTTPFTATAAVTPNQLTHIKLAVADAGDSSFDSAVFLRSGSFVAKPLVSVVASISGANENPLANGEYTFTRTGSPDEALTVQYEMTGTAGNTSDYATLSGTIVFPAGESIVTQLLTPVDDSEIEVDETAILTLLPSEDYAIDVALDAATITIVSDDFLPPDPPDISFSVASQTVDEGAGTVTITMNRTGELAIASEVLVSLVGVPTATPGLDFDQTGLPQTVIFGPNQTSASFTVPILDDLFDELDEVFELGLTSVFNADIVPADQTAITITDNDGPPMLSIGDVQVSESDGQASFVVSLSNPSQQSVSVDFATAIGTAIDGPGGDFVSATGTVSFAAGETSQTVNVTIVDDIISEAAEDFTVTLSNPVNAGIDDGTGVGNIVDDDLANSRVIVVNRTVNEGEVASFFVGLTIVASTDVTVTFATADGTATAGSDYITHQQQITIPAGAMFAPVTFDVTTLTDSLFEGGPNEQFAVQVLSIDAGLVGGAGAPGIGQIKDINGAPLANVVAGPAVSEGNEAGFTVELSHTSSEDIVVRVQTSDGSATSAGDYVASTQDVTISAGDTSTAFVVSTTDDIVNEPDETFNVDIVSIVSGSAFQGNSGTFTIIDDDQAPGLSIDDVTVNEDAGTATFTVSLSPANLGTVTVEYNTNNGTAVAGADFTTTAGTLTFAPGDTSKTIVVPILEDGAFEPDEGFTVSLANAVSADINDGIGDGTIVDNDVLPSLSISDVGVNEGNVTVNFQVTLSAPSGFPVSVNYISSDGTATGGPDYTGVSGTLTFIPGQTMLPIPVDIHEDTTFEAAENFFIDLSMPVGATIADAQGEGTIGNEDAPPVISIEDASALESDTAVQFTAMLSASADVPVMVNYSTVGGTATLGTDFVDTMGVLTFAPGETSATIDVQLLNDAADEPSETFEINLATPTNGAIGTGTATGTIIDDDTPPTISISDESATEGTDLVFTVSLSGTSGNMVTVNYNTMAGTATVNADYTPQVGTLTFNPGETTKTISIPTVGDATDEPNEDLSVTLSSATSATISDDLGVGTINDNDPTPTLSVTDASVTEGNNLVFTVSLSGDSASTITVDYGTADGTATSGVDFTPNSGQLTFAAGTITRTVTLPTIDDNLHEVSENLFVSLSNATNANIADGSGEGTINDNDPEPQILVGSASTTEGGDLVFDVTLSAPSGTTISVNYATADGSAINGNDYTGASGTVTFNPGEMSGQITVGTNNDLLDEDNEDLSVTLSAPINASIAGAGVAQGTILDDDPSPTASVLEDITVNEGAGNAAFTVVLSAASGLPITVDYITNFMGGSATDDVDFTPVSGTLNFNPGQTSLMVSVPIIDDNVAEGDETFRFELTDGNNVAPGNTTALATIIDNDGEPTISIGDAVVGEGGIATFTLTLSGPSATDIDVNFTTRDGAAIDGQDYTGVTDSVTFLAGATSQNVVVSISEDLIAETDENFFVDLSGAVNATINDGTGEGTITDNDAAPDVRISDYAAQEGQTASFTVSLTGETGYDVILTIGATDGTATSPDDFNGSPQQLTIGAGSISATFDTAVVVDGLFEGGTAGVAETYTIGVVNVDSGAVGSTSDTGLGQIVDIDTAPNVSLVAAPPVAESAGGAMFAVELSAASSEDITVTVGATDGTADSPDDYSLANGVVTIAAGTTSGMVSVTYVNDGIDEADETYTLSIDSVVGTVGTLGGPITATILDSDLQPTISIADDSVDEGGVNASFEVTLSAPSGVPVSVSFATANGSAIDGSDYTGNAGVLMFTPGQVSQTVNIAIADDNVDEPVETFEVNLSGASGATIADGQAIGTISDNEATPSVIVDDAAGVEAGLISFNVSLSGPSSEDVTVTLQTTDGSATSPDDFTSTNAQVTIPAGSTSASTTFDVATADDADDEGDETFSVSIISLDAGTADISDTAEGTIQDVQKVFIIDNGDVGYSTIGSWTTFTGAGKGHLDDFDFAAHGGNSDSATWTFDLEQPGQYRVSASYRDWTNRATNAPYTVLDGPSSRGTVSIDQTQAADDLFSDGTLFEDLGIYDIFSNQLSVTLSDLADGFLSADAIRIELLGPAVTGPDIQVESNGATINDGVGTISFGQVSRGAIVRRTIDVSNTGTLDLNLGVINVPAGFSLVSSFGSTTVAPGGSTSFEIEVDTSTVGPLSGELTFTSDDPDESPFNIQLDAEVVSVAVLDNGDPGFTTVGSWPSVVGNGKGFGNDFQFATPGDGSKQATWTFSVAPGQYQVSASWRNFANRATNAPFTISNGAMTLSTVQVNQQVAPGSIVEGGVAFGHLGLFNIDSGTLTVTLSNLADGLVIADAIRIDRVGDIPGGPEIEVESGGFALTDGTGVLDFGTVSLGDVVTQTVIVRNSGTTVLTLDGPINVPTGFMAPAAFAVTTLNPGETTSFDVQVDTSSLGTISGEISFGSNDADEDPYNFTVQAEVAPFRTIVDNSSGTDFATNGSWPAVGRNGHDGGFQYTFKGDGSATATWTVDLPTDGIYRVSVAYKSFTNRVTDAQFTVRDGATPLGTLSVNQQTAPNDVLDEGTWFEDLGNFSIMGNQLVIELSSLSSDADPTNNLIIADAVRIERVGDLP